MSIKGLGALLALTLSAAPTRAGVTTVFDLESEAIGNVGLGSTYEQDGAMISVAVDDPELQIASAIFPIVPDWGDRSFIIGGGSTVVPVRITFEGGASGVSFEYGDFGGDLDTVSVIVYAGPDASGPVLSSSTTPYNSDITDSPAGLFSYETLNGSLGIGSIEIITTGQTGSSLYFDNIGFTVPAPGAASILGISILATRRRR